MFDAFCQIASLVMLLFLCFMTLALTGGLMTIEKKLEAKPQYFKEQDDADWWKNNEEPSE